MQYMLAENKYLYVAMTVLKYFASGEVYPSAGTAAQ